MEGINTRTAAADLWRRWRRRANSRSVPTRAPRAQTQRAAKLTARTNRSRAPRWVYWRVESLRAHRVNQRRSSTWERGTSRKPREPRNNPQAAGVHTGEAEVCVLVGAVCAHRQRSMWVTIESTKWETYCARELESDCRIAPSASAPAQSSAPSQMKASARHWRTDTQLHGSSAGHTFSAARSARHTHTSHSHSQKFDDKRYESNTSTLLMTNAASAPDGRCCCCCCKSAALSRAHHHCHCCLIVLVILGAIARWTSALAICTLILRVYSAACALLFRSRSNWILTGGLRKRCHDSWLKRVALDEYLY